MNAQLKAAYSYGRRDDNCLERPAEALRGADASRNLEIMARFSHELRNSLGAIGSAMHVLRAASPKNAVQEKAQLLAERQIRQMTRLVEDILDTSRIHNGRLQLERRRIDLCVSIARAMHVVECTMRQREHHMTASFPDAPVWLRGDAARLEQVFVNLLVNAAKYTDVGGEVTLSVRQEEDEAVVSIRDSGVGIAADLLPRMFDPYVQGGPSMRGGGLGLGLPLVRSLVEGHGGRVTAASGGAGKGSEFTVRLPAFARP
jgi:signal transduction histidine kinase